MYAYEILLKKCLFFSVKLPYPSHLKIFEPHTHWKLSQTQTHFHACDNLRVDASICVSGQLRVTRMHNQTANSHLYTKTMFPASSGMMLFSKKEGWN
jgi:transposase